MSVCDFRLQASSALLPGGLLEGLLAPMLEKSTRRAVVWQGTPRPKSGSGRALNWKNQARKNHNWHQEEVRWPSCLRDSPFFQHARYCTGLSRDRRTEGIVHARRFQIMCQLHPGCDEG
jgi:hypothetical protein